MNFIIGPFNFDECVNRVLAEPLQRNRHIQGFDVLRVTWNEFLFVDNRSPADGIEHISSQRHVQHFLHRDADNRLNGFRV